MDIRRATEADFEAMWPIFQAVVATSTTYAFAPETPREDAFAFWLGRGVTPYVAVHAGRIVGMYKIVPNQRDLGAHVANASFMVDPAFQGRGAGRAMGEHCLREARNMGYLAMQFNYVVATNEGAVRLWKQLGFRILATQPRSYRHRDLGLVDTFVMHRFLDDIDV